jgi:tripartite-type tricarboxylate transporter receptor subunit TctC
MYRKKLSKRFSITVVLLTGLFITFPVLSLAQGEFPNRSIELVIPFAAGGSTDLISRKIAESAKKYLGQPIIVVNKPGGGQMIGTGYVYNAKPDGYTIGGAASGGLSLRPLLYNIPYDILKLTSIIQVAYYPGALVVKKDAPWNSFEELLTYAKNNPGKVKFSTTGFNDFNHLVLENIARKKGGIKWDCVPSAGEAPGFTMLLGDHVTFFAGGSIWKPHVQSGALKALATWGGKNRTLANVPTLHELGYDVIADTGPIFIGPPGLPDPIVRRLHDAFKKVMDEPQFEEVLNSINLVKEYRNSDELKKYFVDFHRSWGDLIKEMGIKKKDKD